MSRSRILKVRSLLSLIGIVGILVGGWFWVGRSIWPYRGFVDDVLPAIPEKPDPWILSNPDPRDPRDALLWNGLIGVRIEGDGTGGVPGGEGDWTKAFEISGYQPDGEEKIIQLGNPLGESWTANLAQEQPRLRPGAPFAQTLDMRTGVLRTQWTQLLGGRRVQVWTSTAIHPGQAIIAQRWVIRSDAPIVLTYDSGIDSLGQVLDQSVVPGGTRNGIRFDAIVVPPASGGKMELTGRLSGLEGVAFAQSKHSWRGTTKPGTDVTLERVAIISLPIASAQNSNHRKWTFGAVADASKRAWANRWTTDIQIEGPVADQQAVRSFMFYLRSAIHPGAAMSISPFGLSNSKYNGHVFWDADTWVFPALALIEPEQAKEIAEYRLSKERVALHGQWVQFPWESSVSGKDVTPPSSKAEIHITGDVAFMLRHAADLGLVSEADASRVGAESDQFFRQRSSGSSTAAELRNVMSPDENVTGNNDLYTNLLAQWLANGESWHPKKRPAITYKLPRDAKSLLTYDRDTLRAYKQAAAILSIYPLQFPEAEKEARTMMARFADKTIPNGPQMSDSVNAVIWSRLGERSRAYRSWLKSWSEYTGPSFHLFREKRHGPETYFTTGAAGCLQSVIYGFLGFRLDSKKEPGAAWSQKLRGDTWLSIKPNLPTEWKSVKFTNFTVLGRHYTLTVTRSAVQVTKGD